MVLQLKGCNHSPFSGKLHAGVLRQNIAYPSFSVFRYRDTVHKRAVDVVCATYRTLYEAIVDEKNKYLDVKTLVPRTPDQVTSLLT